MRAIVISAFGGPETLELREVPEPSPRAYEVRVRVMATAVNRADLVQRAGFYPAPPGVPADIPGLEFAGVVDAIGEGVTGHATGDRVFGLVGGGSYAEVICVHNECIAKMPAACSFEEAAAFPEAFLTAYDAMVSQLGLLAGEAVLIHAVGSGVGTAAVQLARALGARSIGTARRQDKLDKAAALGLDVGVLATDGIFAPAVLAATGGRGAEMIVDLVGGGYLAQNLDAAAPCGRIALVGLVGGLRAELDLGAVLRKRLRVQGTVMRSRGLAERIAVAQVLARSLVPLWSRGLLRPVVSAVLPLAAAADAHRLVAANETFGKVVLRVA